MTTARDTMTPGADHVGADETVADVARACPPDRVGRVVEAISAAP